MTAGKVMELGLPVQRTAMELARERTARRRERREYERGCMVEKEMAGRVCPVCAEVLCCFCSGPPVSRLSLNCIAEREDEDRDPRCVDPRGGGVGEEEVIRL